MNGSELILGIMFGLIQAQYSDVPSLNNEPTSLRQSIIKEENAVPYLQMFHALCIGEWWNYRWEDTEILITANLKYRLKKHHEPAIKKQIAQLGDDKFMVREKAQQKLIDYGPIILDFLKEADKTDPEVKRRIEQIIKELDK